MSNVWVCKAILPVIIILLSSSQAISAEQDSIEDLTQRVDLSGVKARAKMNRNLVVNEFVDSGDFERTLRKFKELYFQDRTRVRKAAQQALFFHYFRSSPLWKYELSEDEKFKFFEIALQQEPAFSQYRWDLVTLLFRFSSMESVGVILKSATSPTNLNDEEFEGARDIYNQEVRGSIFRRISAWNSGLINHEVPATNENILKLVENWVRAAFTRPQLLLSELYITTPENALRLGVYALENIGGGRNNLNETELEKLDILKQRLSSIEAVRQNAGCGVALDPKE